MLPDRLAGEGMQLAGFHLPGGGIGRIVAGGDGYRFVGEDWPRTDAGAPPGTSPGAGADRPPPHSAGSGYPNMSAVMPAYQPSDSS